jgi:uncharacterized protein DUF6894
MLARSVASVMIDVGGAGRYYFHLTNDEALIRDEEGTEVSSMQSALISAMEMIEELRAENPSEADEWQGWRLEIVDASGQTVYTMPLDIHSLQ